MPASREASTSKQVWGQKMSLGSKGPTVRHRGMGTGISEASKRVPIFFLCYPGRQASEFPFSTEELGPSPRGSDPVPCRLT